MSNRQRSVTVASRMLAFALVVCLGAGCTRSKKPAPTSAPHHRPSPPAVGVVVTRVKSRPVKVYSDYTATFVALETVNVTSRVEGTLLDYSFKQGALVTKDQVLFRIDPRTYQAAVAAAQGQLAQARAQLIRAQDQIQSRQVEAQLMQSKAQLAAAERQVRRSKPLYEGGAIAAETYDEYLDTQKENLAQVHAIEAQLHDTRVSEKADIRVARAALQSAQAQLEQAQLNLSYTTIFAPFTGVIGKLDVDPGNLVTAGQGNHVTLATLSRSDPIYVDFGISEATYLTLARDGFAHRTFSLTLADGADYPYPGKFVMVGRALDGQTGTLTLRVKYSNPRGLLRPGGFGRVRMLVQKLPRALVVPQEAVVRLQSTNVVYVVGSDHKVSERTVVLGSPTGHDYVVESGLKQGETVVVKGVQKLRPGAAVKVTKTL